MCFVEVIDTAGQGKQLLVFSHSQAEPLDRGVRNIA